MTGFLVMYVFCAILAFVLGSMFRKDPCGEFNVRLFGALQVTCWAWPLWLLYAVYKFLKWAFAGLISDLKGE